MPLAAGPSSPPSSEDLFRIGRDADVRTDFDGDVILVGGSLHLDGRISGDVMTVAGDVVLEPNAVIEGDVSALGGSIRTGPGAVIRGDRYASGAAETTRGFSPFSAAVKLVLLLAWFIVSVLITLARGREVRSSSVELRITPFHTLTLGLVAFTSFLLTAVLFGYLVRYIAGIPLIICLGIFAFATKVYGMVAVFHAVGTALFLRFSTTGALPRWSRGDLAAVVLGLTLLGLVRLIPFVGTVVWSTASLIGVGVAVGTWFGHRDPWFLAWRPLRSSLP